MTWLYALVIAAAPGVDAVAIDGPPWVEIGIAIRSDADPADKNGLTAVTVAVVDDALRGAPQCANICGASVTTNGILIRSGATTQSANRELERIFATLTTGRFLDVAVDRAVRRATHDRSSLQNDDRRLGYHELMRVLFEGQPAEQSPLGELAELANISASDVRANLKRLAVKQRTRVVVAGALADDTESVARGLVETLDRGTVATSTTPKITPRNRLRVIVVDKPDRVRAEAVIGWAVDDSPGMPVAVDAWAGAADSPLAEAIVEQADFVTAHVVRRQGANAVAIEIAAAPDRIGGAVAAALAARRTVGQRGIPTAMVERSLQRAAMRSALQERDAATTTDTILARWLDREDSGASTVESVRRAMTKAVSPEDIVVVVVASADGRLLTQLAALPGIDGVSVVAYDTR